MPEATKTQAAKPVAQVQTPPTESYQSLKEHRDRLLSDVIKLNSELTRSNGETDIFKRLYQSEKNRANDLEVRLKQSGIDAVGGSAESDEDPNLLVEIVERLQKPTEENPKPFRPPVINLDYIDPVGKSRQAVAHMDEDGRAHYLIHRNNAEAFLRDTGPRYYDLVAPKSMDIQSTSMVGAGIIHIEAKLDIKPMLRTRG